jgi:hypothetical protein
MIVFHDHECFWVETTIEAGLRGSMRGEGASPIAIGEGMVMVLSACCC